MTRTRPVRVGVLLGEQVSAIEEARAAEQAGYDFVACGEHLFFHGPVPNAFVTLAAAAGATNRIGLVSTITLLPLYPLALAAKLAATLDQVSGGRFELGIGAGGENPGEFTAVGVDPQTRFRRLDEGLPLLRRLLRGETVSADGEFITLIGQRLDPAPTGDAGLPIWLGGRKTAARRRAGRYADVWLPYMVDPEGLERSLGEVRDFAADAQREPGSVTGAVFVWALADAESPVARRRGIEAVSTAYRQDFEPLADRYLALGTPEQVTKRLREFVDAGAERIVVQPACDAGDRARALRVLAAEVLPGLRG